MTVVTAATDGRGNRRVTLLLEPKYSKEPGGGRRRNGGQGFQLGIGREADHEVHTTSVVRGGTLVGRDNGALAVACPAGTCHRDVHLLRRRQSDRLAEPRGAGAGLSRHSAPQRPHPGAVQSPTTAPRQPGKPARSHAPGRRPPRDSRRGNHRSSDGTPAADAVGREQRFATRERVSPTPNTIAGARATEPVGWGELVEPRAWSAARIAADRGPLPCPDLPGHERKPHAARVCSARISGERDEPLNAPAARCRPGPLRVVGMSSRSGDQTRTKQGPKWGPSRRPSVDEGRRSLRRRLGFCLE